ncbi:parapinopsin-like [Bufo gargarizans]|uniref:parapinopsin-like n=1 Tax=Bufo gargarizans TaxID=30331 RepID=UPI001CF47E3D|nr:parapinopsin-like [Bufo gargarizans]
MAQENILQPLMNFSHEGNHGGKVLMPRIGYTILAIIMAIFCTAAIILNVTVIIVTIKYRQLRHPINYSLVNLAVADLGVTVLGGLLTVETNAVGYFNLGRIGCVIEGFAVAFFGIAALCTIAVIAVDRVFVVCRPMGTLTFTHRQAMAGIAVAWIWSLVWNTPPLFGWGSYQLEGVETSCAPDWYSTDPVNMSYILSFFCFCFAIPFLIIVVSYGYLIWTLRQVAKLGVAEGGTTSKAEVQVSRMVLVMIMAFLICWLPYAVFAMMVVANPGMYIDPVIATVPMYLTKTSTVYNPIIYIFMNKQFQECMIPFLCCGRNPWAIEPSVSAETKSANLTSSNSRKNQVSPA